MINALLALPMIFIIYSLKFLLYTAILFIDCFTIPFCFIVWLICKIFKRSAPRLTHYKWLVYPTWQKKRMSGIEYEHHCAWWLSQHRFRDITVTPASGDFGADIIAFDEKGRKWVFQCKHYSSKLGNKPIQEVVAAKSHYNAVCAGVITNSCFTDKARQLARENNVKLFEHIR